MGNPAGAKTKVYIIVSMAFLWAAFLLVWLLRGGPSSETLGSISEHGWAVLVIIAVFMAVFWTWFLARSRKSNVPRSLLVLRISSDVLLLALIGGALVWNWPSTALIVIGSALVLSYGARFMNSAVRLSRRQ